MKNYRQHTITNHNKNLRFSLIASCFLAGCLEMYDFTIFGFLITVLHKQYISFVDEQTATIFAYMLFAIGFIFRPLGSIIFGYIGDVYGRKKALVTSVSCMGLASLTMSCLPTYEAIGIISCYIIALVRIIQGVSVGGEFTGAIIYAVEHHSKKHAGFIGSFVVGGCLSGILLATMVSNIVTHSSLPEYSWRFAFLLGFGLSIVGYFIRKNLRETPEFLNITQNKDKFPLFVGLKKYKLQAVTTILIGATTGTNIYYAIVYLPKYLNDIFHQEFSYLPIITTLVMAIFSPIFGFI